MNTVLHFTVYRYWYWYWQDPGPNNIGYWVACLVLF